MRATNRDELLRQMAAMLDDCCLLDESNYENHSDMIEDAVKILDRALDGYTVISGQVIQ